MDIMMMSEFDPYSSDELLGMFFYFESAMFANPLALSACSLECGLLSAGGTPKLGEVWWCLGCWGGVYPMSNHLNTIQSNHNTSSSLSGKMLAVKHRRGLGHTTYGSSNMCGGKRSLFMPKEQYKWQHLFPVAEATSGKCCHWTGVSEYVSGGVMRNIPYTGEDTVQVLFRFIDCCAH